MTKTLDRKKEENKDKNSDSDPERLNCVVRRASVLRIGGLKKQARAVKQMVSLRGIEIQTKVKGKEEREAGKQDGRRRQMCVKGPWHARGMCAPRVQSARISGTTGPSRHPRRYRNVGE
jgi:hypothetical protein